MTTRRKNSHPPFIAKKTEAQFTSLAKLQHLLKERAGIVSYFKCDIQGTKKSIRKAIRVQSLESNWKDGWMVGRQAGRQSECRH